ncbi:MAG: S8 family peptidase, partial [Candidatus Aminicenantaceae bacterium]
MKKKIVSRISILSLLSLIFLFVSSNSVTTQERYSFQDEYVPNEVLVKFKKDVGKYLIKEGINSVQGKVITNLGEEISTFQWDPNISSLRSFLLDPDLLHIKVPEAIGTEQAIYSLNLNPNIEYAEKNLIVHICVDPVDTHFWRLWGLKNTGQTDGTYDADIDAPEAWDIFTGSSDIVVAVIDSGIDYEHIDLQANIWINLEEFNGDPGVDDDGNGYVDDIRGWNFVNNNNDPMDDYSLLNIYHGTHVAGTIGAVGNNDTGVTGVNWNVKLMAVKSLGSQGGGTIANAVKAIDYSTKNEAHLSNNSWTIGSSYSQALFDAISRAKDKEKLFVAAAGNFGPFSNWFDNDQKPVYPASYNLDNIIAVLSTDHNDDLSWFSHYGHSSVDIGAPGGSDTGGVEDIYSTKRGNDYQYLCGTSMAAPHVTGVAALVLGICPLLSHSQLKTRILNKSDYLSSLNNKCVSSGRLNAYSVIYDPSPPPSAAPSNLSAIPTAWDIIRLTWQDNSNYEIGFEVKRKKAGEANFSHLKSVDDNVI